MVFLGRECLMDSPAAEFLEIRDILTPMNYRRGLQRVYAALTVVWIAGVLFAVLMGRWEPWHRFEPQNGWSFVNETPTVSPEDFLNGKTARLSDIDDAATQRMIMHQRWAWASGISTVPPLVLYFLLFYVAPWIYRGFRPNA